MSLVRSLCIGTLSIFFRASCFSNPLPMEKMNTARLLLANLRGGDYAHPGDKDAIDMVIRKVLELSPDIQKGICLDIGSGLGGTANYMYESGFPLTCSP